MTYLVEHPLLEGLPLLEVLSLVTFGIFDWRRTKMIGLPPDSTADR